MRSELSTLRAAAPAPTRTSTDIGRKTLRIPVTSYLTNGNPLCLLTAPVIYSTLVPMLVLDVWITVYMLACFPVYGLPLVKRRDYFLMDRHRLPYLNGLEKLNCAFCSYANGLVAYVREILGRTEAYWCPIRHAQSVVEPHAHYERFVPYGDARAFRARERQELRQVKRFAQRR